MIFKFNMTKMFKIKPLTIIFCLLISLCLPVQAMVFQSLGLQQYDKELVNSNAVYRLYKQRDVLWLEKHKLTNQAHDALDFMASASRHGLNADHYHLPTLRQLDPSQDNETAQYFDVLLTDGLLALIHDLAVGRLEAHKVDPQWFIPQAKFDAVTFLQQALLSPHLKTQLTTLISNTHDNIRLTEALARYQGYVDRGGWPTIPDMPLIHVGDHHRYIPVIQARLAFEGVLLSIPSVDNSELYDSVTEQAVRRFQQHHGLKVDGVIGAETRNELNISAQDRVQQIKVTLERQRWMPADLGTRYVKVNLANYTLSAVDNGIEKLAMRVIVGRKDRPTPSFVSQITRMVINPYWTVPRKLAVLDLLPKQQANFNYFFLHEIRVFSDENGQRVEQDPYLINWQSVNKKNFHYTLRQDPGDHNALGRIKFLFPNPWAIYLHDTSHRSLFNKTKRNLSSGCIRVENPLGFADFTLADSEGHAYQTLLDIITSKKNKGIKLAEPLSIYAVYFTVSVEGDEVIFSPDSYQRDRLIADALQKYN